MTALAIVPCLAVAGCGGSQPHSAAPRRSAVQAAFRGAPAALAALHAQSDRLLGGGRAAFAARLRALRGHPVVVNLWASWCEPCRTEFPAFQSAAVADGRRIAFLGLDSRDQPAAARGFLAQFPVTYPSYVDPGQRIAAAYDALGGIPQTLFFGASGTLRYTHAGPYLTAAALQRDIRVHLG